MADVNANIGVNIDTSEALVQLKALQRQISQFHTSIAKSSESAALAQRDLQKNFLNSVNAIGTFSAELRTVRTTAESFTDSLEKNKFSMREYFRFAGGSTKTFGKLFKSEFDTIEKVAEDRVKRLQTQYIKLGRDTSGVMKAIAIMPNQLDMGNFSTQSQIAAQKQAIFNQLVKQGSTNLLNFGKNTQWAGRQLMVGFTLPLMALGTAATRTFMEMEEATIKFRKVYGDLFTPKAETEAAIENITALGQSFTKYGVAVSQTVGLAAEAAAAGFQGVDLQRQTAQATRLSVLGQIEANKALETTISLQNAFKMSSDQLAGSIDFLNAVENQTVVSLDDITTAIPKVAPVIQQLGGDVKDLAFFMAAMKEGGINASEGANALKSGLAALINPTAKASAILQGYGINIKKIVEGNQGDLKATVVDFAKALDTLDPLTRARAIEQLFGKFQFARLSTLFDNVTNETGQAARVLELAGTSIEDLAKLSETELGVTADSAMNKFRKSVEDLKLALVPVGQTFLQAVTPILEFVGGIIEKFNNLSSGVKKAIVVLTVGIGAIGPVALMTFGLLANGIANIVKGAMILRNGYLRLTGQSQILGEQTEYLTMEQIDAAAASHSLDQAHARLTQTFTVESGAVGQLKAAYEAATIAGAKFAAINPGMMRAPNVIPTKRAEGKPVVVGGTGNQDTELALLTPGETVIPAKMSKKYGSLINGMIAGNIPGYIKGKVSEEFLSTRPGRNASGGERAQVNIPGGYQLGHFAEVLKMTGAELRKLAESEAQSFKDTVERMIASVSNGLDQSFDVFTNEVTAQSQELNQALGEVGSNKQAPIELFKKEAVAQAGGYNAPLIAKMKKAGASTESIESAVESLAREFEEGINKLGEVTTVTAEDVNRITQEAYAKVAEANKDVAAARQELSKPGALKEIVGITSGRKSLKGGYNTPGEKERINATVQEQIPGVYPTQQAFNFTGEAARKVGVQNAIAIRQIFDQLDQEAQSRVRGLLGDIDAMSQQVILEAQNAGIDLGKYAIRGIAKGIEAQSPSQAAKREGQKVVDGFEQGMLEGMDDASLAAAKVSNAATGSLATPGVVSRAMGAGRGASRPQGPVPIGPIIPAGTKMLPIVTVDAINAETKARKTSIEKIDSMNRSLMAGTFALTSLAGAGSMAGGSLGKLSNQVMKYSGLLFALMSVTQLLTQTKIAELVATRAGLAKSAVANAMAAGPMFGGTSKALAGRAGLLGGLARAGILVTRFLGPVGLVTTALFAAYKIIDLSNKAREKERQRLEAFSDVLSTTSAQTKFLGEQFNFIPIKGSLEQFEKDLERVSVKTRTEREQIKESEGFQSAYGQTISQVRGMTDKQAQSALTFKGLELISQGMAKEQVQALIDAIKEEAGKKDLKFDFKSISFDKKGIIDLTSEIGTSLDGFQKEFQSGLQKVYQQVAVGEGRSARINLVERLIPNKEAKAALKNASAAIASYSLSLNRLAQSGSMDMRQFKEATDAMFSQIEKSVPDANTQLRLFNRILRQISPSLADAAMGVNNLKDKQLLLRAAIAGVTNNLIVNAATAIAAAEALNKVADANLKAFGVKSTSADQARALAIADNKANEAKAALNKSIEEEIRLAKIRNAVTTDTTTTGTEKSAFQLAIEQLQNQQQELKNTAKAYGILEKAGFDAETALKYASDSVIALGLATGKISPEQLKQVSIIMEDIEKRAGSGAIRDFLVALEAENTLKKDFDEIIPRLLTMGATTEDIQGILGNPMLMKSFLDKAATAEQVTKRIERYLSAIKEGKAIDINIEFKINPEEAQNKLQQKANDLFSFFDRVAEREYKPKIIDAEKEVKNAQDAIDKIQKDIDDIQKGIDLEQRNIEKEITRPIEEYQEQINDFQRKIEIDFERPLAALADESSVLSEQLTLMDKAAEDINSKYDKQEEALQKISDINQEISNQQKQQLGLADALSRGDISAAAQAIQEIRSSQAEAASSSAETFLQAARQAEIAGLKSTSGLTRKQIEDRQYKIERESYQLNFDRKKIEKDILDLQDKIYALEEKREEKLLAIRKQEDLIYEATKNQLDVAKKKLETSEKDLAAVRKGLEDRLADIDAQRDAWELAADATFAATVNAGDYNDVLDKTIGYLSQVLGLWKEIVDISSGGSYVAPRDTPESAAALDDFIKIVEELDAAQLAYDAAVESGNMYAVRNAGIALGAAQKSYNSVVSSSLDLNSSGGSGGRNMMTLASGGKVSGPGTATSDSIPAYLSDGEYVIKASSVNKYGAGTFDALNAGKFAKGGFVSSAPHSMGMSSFGSRQNAKPKPDTNKATSLFDKKIWEKTANFFALPEMAKTGFDMAKYGGPDKMLIARLLGAPMKSSLGDNATTALNIIPIPVGKALKPLLKMVPDSLKAFLAKNGIGKIGTQIDEAYGSIYKKENVSVGEEIFPTYKIGNKKDSVAFQGFREDISSLSEYGVRTVPTTPEGLLAEALNMNPNNKNILTMLENFKNNELGKEEYKLLDEMAAAVSVNSKGKDTGVEKTDGFAMLLASLSGNKKAKKIIDFKRDSFYDLIEDAKTLSRNNRSSGKFQVPEGPIDTSAVPVIHSTGHSVIRDKNGDVVLHPYGNFNIGTDKAVPRSSLHTTLYAPVESHLFGQWDAAQTRIVSSLENMTQANGLPYNVNGTDTWWQLNPGEGLTVPNPSIIRSFNDSKAYREELIARGLIQPTEITPPVSIDSDLKEVLHLQKKAYNSVERLQVSRIAKEIGLAREVAPGQETEMLQNIALRYAKEQQGVDTASAKLEQWGLNSESLNQHIYRIAEKYDVDSSIHSGSTPEILEKILMREASTKNQNTVPSYSKTFSDSIEAIRMTTRHGRFKTEIERLKDDAFDDFANGGIVKGIKNKNNKFAMAAFASGGAVKPKYFSSGGPALGTDTIPAMLTPGEFIMSKYAVDSYGVDKMKAINTGTYEGEKVYNYNLNVNVKSDSNPDDIARVVIKQIQQLDNQRIRKQAN